MVEEPVTIWCLLLVSMRSTQNNFSFCHSLLHGLHAARVDMTTSPCPHRSRSPITTASFRITLIIPVQSTTIILKIVLQSVRHNHR